MTVRTVQAELSAQLTARYLRPAILVEMGTSTGTVYVWSGLGTLTWNGNDFAGVGQFGGMDAVEETTDLSATGTAFSLSGVPEEMLATALDYVRQGYQAKAWLAAFTDDGVMDGEPFLFFDGLTDVGRIHEDVERPVITVTAESRMKRLSIPKNWRYTPEDQKIYIQQLYDRGLIAAVVADEGFNYVDGLQDAQIKFGN